jgi:hypothetical protein
LWTATVLSPASDPHPATPIIAKDGSLYVETGADTFNGSGGYLYHVSSSGTLLSSTPPPAGMDGFDVCPSLSNGGLLMDGDDADAVAVYTPQANGTLTLTISTPEITLPIERVSVAVAADDTSYWCLGNLCRALSPPSAGMKPVATWPTAGVQPAPDAPAAGVNYFSASDLAWDATTTGYLFVAVAWTSDNATGQVEVSALSPSNGQVVWHVLLPSAPLPTTISGWYWCNPFLGNGAPTVAADGTVYVGSVDGLHALDGKTGAVKPGFPVVCGDVESAPAIGGDGTVFFGCEDHSFYAVSPSGAQRFKITTGARVTSSPAIGPDGSVYFVSDDGNLYAVH